MKSILNKLVLISICAALILVAGCTLYQSDGRKCIAEGCASFIKPSNFMSVAESRCPLSKEESIIFNDQWYEVSPTNNSEISAYLDMLSIVPRLIVLYKKPRLNAQRVCSFTFNDQLDLENNYKSEIENAAKYLSWLTDQT